MGADTHARVKNLLADALTLPPHEREAFVRAQSDDAVIVREVLELLAQGTWDVLPPIQPPGDEDDEDLVGIQVGQYRIIDQIDGGGQARVYIGRDPSLHRKVALKSLLPFGTAQEVRAAALREARAAARVSHPNVTTIHQVIEQDSRAFIVMEFLEGETLARVLRRGRLPLESVFAMGRQLASAVAAAHAKGVVHRDLKPGNVQVLPDGSIKVLDFGIAGVLAALTTMTRVPMNEHTHAGQPGTPGYMSPEQVSSSHFDERSDIFSLGIMLFEMATGTRAYQERESASLLAAARRPLRRADAVAPDVPRDLADVIAQAVEIDPSRRFDSAVSLGRALDAAGGALLPLPERRRTHRRSLAARFWSMTAVVAPVLAAVFIAIGWLNSRTFNLHLERSAFANETWLDVLTFGAKSFAAPLFMLAVLIAGVSMLVVARYLAVRASATLRVSDDSVARTLKTATRRLSLDEAPVAASWLLLVCVVALGAGWWWFSPLIKVMFSRVSEAPAEALALLAPAQTEYHQNYRKVFSVITITCIVAWYYQGRELARSSAASHRLLLAAGIAVCVLALGTLQLPYRFMRERASFPVTLYQGQTCFRLGANAVHVQLLCPDVPSRIVLVPLPADNVKAAGAMANVFEPFASRAPAR